MAIINTVARDACLEKLTTAAPDRIWRGPVKRRYVDDTMKGQLASVGVYASDGQGSPAYWITVNVDTCDCAYYAPGLSGAPVLQHEEKSEATRDLVAGIVAMPVAARHKAMGRPRKRLLVTSGTKQQ